jgi:hypothetical protein
MSPELIALISLICVNVFRDSIAFNSKICNRGVAKKMHVTFILYQLNCTLYCVVLYSQHLLI